MVTALESRANLQLVTQAAVASASQILTDGRSAVLELVPSVISYFSEGSAALAADSYEDERDQAGIGGSFRADLVIADRGEKIGRALAWATDPLVDGAGDAPGRLAEVVQLETARPYRDTILTNRHRDPMAIGWRRIAHDGCPFCRMLADRGAVYRESTARFAAHENCHCTAQPVFKGQPGDEASVMQYTASKRRRSKADQENLRRYLAANYGA